MHVYARTKKSLQGKHQINAMILKSSPEARFIQMISSQIMVR